ncbi:MAG TPA: hypothetical protein VN380_23490 [Thermoanaerobaculia bacterium]|jgi:hypothetical protein|nr:hypothetical protein [Thermoanaerobaculia bacterium]
MTDVYRKWGRVVRYENGVTIHVEEAGEASETNGVFLAKPAQTRVSVPHTSQGPILESAGPTIEAFVAQTLLSVRPCTVERLIVSAGIARHEINGVTWTEESQRVHISLTQSPLRVLVDLASFDLAMIEKIATALARAGHERKPPGPVRLAPNVAAAILPSLIGELAMEQTGRGLDGRGQPIETRAVTADPPPNWYRPGYAVQPVRAWLNIRALPFGSIDKRAPLAIALLGPAEGTMLRVLCDDGEAVFPTIVEAGRIAAVSRDEPAWYPYAAGSFGAEMML